MSSPSQTAAPSKFKPVLDDALAEYKKKTGNALLAHWLADPLQSCESVYAVLCILRKQAKPFEQSGNQKLMKWIDPLVHILHTFSKALNDGDTSLAFPPAKVIVIGIGILLDVAKDARASHDAIIDLFESIESSFRHLGSKTQISLTTEMVEVFVKIVIELLSILSIATKEVKRRRAKIFPRTLIEMTDILDALKRLDCLIQEELQMAIAQTLKFAANHDLEVKVLQPTTRASTHLPTVSLGGAAASATTFTERVGDPKADGDDAIVPSSTWWDNLKRKRTNPIEQAEGYARIRSRTMEAIGGVLGIATCIGNEALFTGVDLLQSVPVPGLITAGKTLLSIWDTVQMVETNRLASLRLVERCANILISIRGEIADAGYTISEELGAPIEKLVKAFEEVRSCLSKLGRCPFLKRYLRRNDILSNISACDTALNDAREMFNASVQIRILKLVKANELRQKEMLESLSRVSPSMPSARFPLPSAALRSFPADTENVRNTLHALCAEQNAQDRARDTADLHRLMLTAVTAKDDVSIIEVLQIAPSEMPDAIRTLERALEHLVEDGQLDAETTTALPSSREEVRNRSGPYLDHSSANTLDRKFMATGIDALRRLSKGTDLGLPSWTITRFEVDLGERVGLGSFSEVFRGTWRKHTVAVKVLDKTTPREVFLREVKIWKSLYHPNVLELFGASSASGDPPWFLVCKYYPQGNLVNYLKGLSKADAARFDTVKVIYEISEGMAYLHGQDVLHGDLKAANILVDDDTSCVISDFGQSEMKSEVYRLTRASQPRGTLRWQAPELMEGAQKLRPEMDVYAFAICCWEILNMGALPWQLTDDSTVRHLVLNENIRPELPPSNLVGGHLINVIRLSWDRVPSKRPSFDNIVRELRKQRAGSSTSSDTAYLYKAKALYAYTASTDDPHEISFSKGEIFDIVDTNHNWWEARKEDGTVGIAPSNHLQII